MIQEFSSDDQFIYVRVPFIGSLTEGWQLGPDE